MRTLWIAAVAMLPLSVGATPVQADVGDAHVVVVRPVDSWDPNHTTADYSLDSIKKKMFGFKYVDAAGALILPRSGGMLSSKVATPLSDEAIGIMAKSGFTTKGSHMYSISAPVSLDPAGMRDFVRVQNEVHRAAVVEQGDPSTLASRVAGKQFLNVFATAVTAKFGIDRFGANAVNLSQWGSLYTDISKLTGGAGTALLPIALPDVDFSSFSEVQVRKVTDNAGHLGEIVIAYKRPRDDRTEQAALAQAIALAGGVGTTVEDVEAARAADYSGRVAIWSSCGQSPNCAKP